MVRAVLLTMLLVALAHPICASASPIYVYSEKSGSIRFSNIPPRNGVEAKVFTAKSSGFSLYKVGQIYKRGAKLFPNYYHSIISSAADEHSVDQHLITAVIHAESAFNPRAVSRKGALGLMQLMPENVKLFRVKNAFRPVDNIHAGTRFLSLLLKRFNGNLKFALAAYNAGPEVVDRYGGIPPYSETRSYVKKVLALRDRYIKSSHG